MNLTEISFSKVKSEIELYLKQEYSKSNILFTPASPYGQILLVVENLYQLSMVYLKNTIKQFDLSDSDNVANYHQAWWENFINKNVVRGSDNPNYSTTNPLNQHYAA